MRSIEEIADLVLQAMGRGDVSAFAALLHPDVTWSINGDQSVRCLDRAEVLAWYQQSLTAGVRSKVTKMQVAEKQIVLALEVGGRTADPVEGWQVLAVRDGLIVEIVGFDDHAAAMDWVRRADGVDP